MIFFSSGMYFTAVLNIFCSNHSNGSWTICEEFSYAKHSVIDIQVDFQNNRIILPEVEITPAECTVLWEWPDECL